MPHVGGYTSRVTLVNALGAFADSKKPVEIVASFLYVSSPWLALPLDVSNGLQMITNPNQFHIVLC